MNDTKSKLKRYGQRFLTILLHPDGFIAGFESLFAINSLKPDWDNVDPSTTLERIDVAPFWLPLHRSHFLRPLELMTFEWFKTNMDICGAST
jgi:hypothetical protein